MSLKNILKSFDIFSNLLTLKSLNSVLLKYSLYNFSRSTLSKPGEDEGLLSKFLLMIESVLREIP